MVMLAGCGGSVVIVTAGGSGNGDDAASTMAAPGPTSPDDGSIDASDDGDGSRALGYGSSGAQAGGSGNASSGGAPIVSCTSAADCVAGQVCCAPQDLVATCMTGPCPPAAPLQFCAGSAECLVPGSTCTHLLSEPEDSYMACAAP
jgi:hypothetical protein